MKRTRKWGYVAQEAKRLADLGLSGYAIAKRLEVSEATVSRWVKAGKLTLKRAEVAETRADVTALATRQSPEEWAASVRADYALSTTDDQLVTMAEAALRDSQNVLLKPAERMAAQREFRANVKQLALVGRVERQQQKPDTTPAVEQPKRPALQVVRKPRTDPRAALAVAK